jgi:hypothetical protein
MPEPGQYPSADTVKKWAEAHDGKLPSDHLVPQAKRAEDFEKSLSVPSDQTTAKKYFGHAEAPAGLILESREISNNRIHAIAINEPGATLAVSPAKNGIVLALKGKGASYGTHTVNVGGGNSVLLELSGHREGTRVELGGEFQKPTMLALDSNPSNEIGVPAGYEVTVRPDARYAFVNVMPVTKADAKLKNGITVRLPVGEGDKLFATSEDKIIGQMGIDSPGLGYRAGPDTRTASKRLNVVTLPSKSDFSNHQVKLVLFDPAVPGVERVITLQNGIPLDRNGTPIVKTDDNRIENRESKGIYSDEQLDKIQAFLLAEIDALRQKAKERMPQSPGGRQSSGPVPTEASLAMAHSSNPLPGVSTPAGLKR